MMKPRNHTLGVIVWSVFIAQFLLCGCGDDTDENAGDNTDTSSENGNPDGDADSDADGDADSDTDADADADSDTDGDTEVPTTYVTCEVDPSTDELPGSMELGLANDPVVLKIPGGTADERNIFDQLNAERVSAGLTPIIWSDQVSNVARSHAADMNQLDYFDHGSFSRPYRDENGDSNSDNWLPHPRLDFVYAGEFRRAGENIAMTGDPVANVVEMWMNSPGHYAAIMDEYGWDATHGGLGIDDRMVVFSPAQCE